MDSIKIDINKLDATVAEAGIQGRVFHWSSEYRKGRKLTDQLNDCHFLRTVLQLWQPLGYRIKFHLPFNNINP